MSKRTGFVLIALVLAALTVFGLFIYPRQITKNALDTYLTGLPNIAASEYGPVNYDAAKGDLQVDRLRITLSAPAGVSLEIGQLEMQGLAGGDRGTLEADTLILADVKLLTPQGAHSFERIIVNDARIPANFLPGFEAGRVEIRRARNASSQAGASASLTVESAILTMIRGQSAGRAVLVDTIRISGIRQLSRSGTITRYDHLSIDKLELGQLVPTARGFFSAQGADIPAWASLLRALRFEGAQLSGVESVTADQTTLLKLNALTIEGYQSGAVKFAKLEEFRGREPNARAFFSGALLEVRDLDAAPALADISAARQPDFSQLWARDISLEGVAFEDDLEGEIAAISKLRVQRGDGAGGWPRTGNIELDRFSIDTRMASGPVNASALQALGYGRLVLSLNLDQEWSPEIGVLRLSEGALSLASGGTARFDIDFRGVDPEFFASGLLAADFTGLPVARAVIGFEDEGLAARIIQRSANGSNRSLVEARVELLANLQTNLAASHFAEFADELTAAVSALAIGGGKATLTARPANTVTLGDILQIFTGGPPGGLEDLNLDVTYTRP